jgi:SAM-dependent methyltransferase
MNDRRPRPSGTAEEVRAFYEQHPYPPPVANLDRYRHRWQDPRMRRLESHLYWPAEPYRADRSILVAGCGTSQAAKHALRWPEAQVVGIDVSKTSIRETRKLKQKYGLDNLELFQLPIEKAGELGREFDHVVCTGVLHHLPDPDAGLRSLRDVLAPGGAMQVMVYAPYGRAGIYLIQEYCQKLGIAPTSREIRDLTQILRSLPSAHPLAPLMANAPDFADPAALADALLNPQDRPYSVPEFMDFLNRSGLQFGRWVRQAPYLPQSGMVASSPHRAKLEKLSARDQYAAIELLRGTMVTHSAVVYRDDAGGDPQALSFEDERWLDYVPLPMPGCVVIQQNLPPGAVAVVLNRAHTYTDLFVPLTEFEAFLFARIDGQTSCRDMVEAASDTLGVADLMQTLWRSDQIIFDRSNGSPSGAQKTPS